uniref:Barrier-to-autointegration factor n=1 Tax=Oryctolagus cuniculus TaxID=9986 RepID=A0A5F9DS29_RABIT
MSLFPTIEDYCEHYTTKKKKKKKKKLRNVHGDFVAESTGEKPVGRRAGMDGALGKRLEERGFHQAYVDPGQFPVGKKDQDLFREWPRATRDCCGCLREPWDAFLCCFPVRPRSPAPALSSQEFAAES